MTAGRSSDGQRSETNHPSRRRLLSLVGTAALATLAGCNGSDESAPNGTASVASPSETSTVTPKATRTATETVTAEPTATPTATQSVEEKLAEYGCPGEREDVDIVVAQDGSGDYESVQAAIDAVPVGAFDGTRILIREGRYKEKVRVPSNLTDVTLVGESAANTVLTYDDHADKTNDHGEELGTSGSASFFASGLDFTAKNLTFENAAPDVAQAVAIRVDGDRAYFDNCRFLGNQDTLYTYTRGTRQYYRNCYVEGDVDFIFGLSTAVFENCKIHCKDEGYVTAAATPADQSHGYVFKDCVITGDAPENSVYLGRPWEPHAQTVFMNSYLGEVIRTEGWEPWDEPDHGDKTKTAFYAEYENDGPGYTPDQRVDWSHRLSDEEAAAYESLETIFDGWAIRACLEGDAS